MRHIKATAIAHPNIAFIKYWGKRNEELKLPTVSSLSMTLDNFYTKTTVEFNDSFTEDSFVLNGKPITGGIELLRVTKHLDLIRTRADKNIKTKTDKKLFAKVASENNFPTASGIASSSSGFTALTLAACKSIGLDETDLNLKSDSNLKPDLNPKPDSNLKHDLNLKHISIVARQGSGSACRSTYGGFVEWKKGEADDGKDSYAEQLFDEKYWPELKMIVLILDQKEKKIKSTQGMRISVETSPFYNDWAKTSIIDLQDVKAALNQKDFTKIGNIMERNCLKMHSVMISSNPSLIYWRPETLTLMENIKSLRETGTECYFTIDAGANVMVLCLDKDVDKILNILEQVPFIHDFIICSAGKGVELSEEHLF
ncbi:diphosphomevalonate decarboxylase [Candidatus Woesearchaeota archaeon]|nr:diphosphomevalonate decarboxylase [Candidatus Woesearchaeota archaeon]